MVNCCCGALCFFLMPGLEIHYLIGVAAALRVFILIVTGVEIDSPCVATVAVRFAFFMTDR